MGEHEAVRTLVKSAPELWDVCSDPDSLGRHLAAFGEIRITRVEPETTVAWEGDRVSGTVRIEPSGWGTRVTLTASSTPVVAAEPEPPAVEPVAVAAEPPTVEPPAVEPEGPPADPGPAVATPRRGIFRRLGGLLLRSFVTPVEFPDEASALPTLREPSPDDAIPATRSEPQAAAVPQSEREPESVVEPGSAVEPLRDQLAPALGPALTAGVTDAVPGPDSSAKSTDVDPALVLETMLNRLGRDHRRPFSRA
jgi:hypothetical protein